MLQADRCGIPFTDWRRRRTGMGCLANGAGADSWEAMSPREPRRCRQSEFRHFWAETASARIANRLIQSYGVRDERCQVHLRRSVTRQNGTPDGVRRTRCRPRSAGGILILARTGGAQFSDRPALLLQRQRVTPESSSQADPLPAPSCRPGIWSRPPGQRVRCGPGP